MAQYIVFEITNPVGPYSMLGGKGVALVPSADPQSPWQVFLRQAGTPVPPPPPPPVVTDADLDAVQPDFEVTEVGR
jgi:hypothetical protein